MFESVNELDKFIYDDCVVKDFKYDSGRIKIELDALIVAESNSQNANTATMILSNASIDKIIIAGYKEYDANDVLINSVDDRELGMLEYDAVFKKLIDTYMYRMMYMGKEGAVYKFDAEFETPADDPVAADLRTDTYVISMSFEKSVVSFERYLNRVQQ